MDLRTFGRVTRSSGCALVNGFVPYKKIGGNPLRVFFLFCLPASHHERTLQESPHQTLSLPDARILDFLASTIGSYDKLLRFTCFAAA